MTSDASPTALIFGCGYLGIRVARRVLRQGWQVAALTRSPARARHLVSEGIQPVVGDWTDARSYDQLPRPGHILFAVGYDARDRHSRHSVYVDGLRRALDHVRPEARTVYISSTGVYHQSDGMWVDERSPTRPTREGGQAHLRAEQLLRRIRNPYAGGRDVVLRLAGIYGPDRVPWGERIRRGEAIAADPDGYLNLIHVDDAADCVLAAWRHPAPAPLYAVADGHPVRRREYYREIARLVGAPSPTFAPGASGPPTSRSETNKRIWTARLRRDLLPRLQYPTYREGLRAILGRGGGCDGRAAIGR